jgi:hypothetical protein
MKLTIIIAIKRFVIIVNICNRFDKALMEIFQLCMALVHTITYAFWHMRIPFLCSSSSILMFVQCSLVCAIIFFGISTVEELTQPSMQKCKQKFGINIFACEGHYP